MQSYNFPLGNDEFAKGLVTYSDSFPGQSHQRSYIVIPITLNGFLHSWAIMDTGAEFCVITPQIANELSVNFYGRGRRYIAGGDYDGRYGVVSISLNAEQGVDLILPEVHVWVPQLRVGQEWQHPNILGLTGFLQKIRFAVDPENNLFYFGAFGD